MRLIRLCALYHGASYMKGKIAFPWEVHVYLFLRKLISAAFSNFSINPVVFNIISVHDQKTENLTALLIMYTGLWILNTKWERTVFCSSSGSTYYILGVRRASHTLLKIDLEETRHIRWQTCSSASEMLLGVHGCLATQVFWYEWASPPPHVLIYLYQLSVLIGGFQAVEYHDSNVIKCWR